MFRIKICGIKRLKDALNAHRYGADAIGMLVGQEHASPDFLSADEASAIVRQLPSSCAFVLVTHKTDPEYIAERISTLRPAYVQLHGNSTVQEITHLRSLCPRVKIIKSIHVLHEESMQNVQEYEDHVDAILLDTINLQTDQIGGTGKPHDWNISAQIASSSEIPIILAGGLNAENIENAIAMVHPYAVDVNSGTKGIDGYKDNETMKLFIKKALSAFQNNDEILFGKPL